MEIRYIPKEEIDKTRWNSCIHYSINGNVFGYKWYLDSVAKDWGGLVEGNYESVMPLIKNEKGIYQPELIREAGVYTSRVPSRTRIQKFIESIPEEYESINIHLNTQNKIDQPGNFEASRQSNYQLLLSRPYDNLAENFDPELQELLKTAAQYNFSSTTSLKPEDVADFFKKHTTQRKNIDHKYYAFLRIMYNALHRGLGFASGIYDEKKNLLAANFFIFSHGKIVSLMPVESAKGKKKCALAFLFNMVLLTNAKRTAILDFNGENHYGKLFGGEAKQFLRIQRGTPVLEYENESKKSFWSIFK